VFFGEFLRRSVFGHAVVVLGIMLDTVVFFLMLQYASAPMNEVVSWYLALAAATLAIGGYLTWREERLARAALEQRVTMTAQIGSFSANIPDPGPDKQSITLEVLWEIWFREDVATDRIGLNMIYVYNRPWWKVWKNARRTITGIPPKGGSTQYRQKLSPSMYIPFKDHASFEYISDVDEEGDPYWLLELVLHVGVPQMRIAVPIALPSREEMDARGTTPPL
jgi:hypothetical protein